MTTTAHFLIWTIVLQVIIGFTLAWLINRKFKGNDLLTTLIVVPMMLSPAVVGNFWTFLYQPQIGMVNYIVEFFTGIPAASFSMLGPGRPCPLVDHHRRHLDVDALRHADLPRRTAVDPRLHL